MDTSTQDLGSFGNPDDDILKYLMEDTPSPDGSSPDSTPPSAFEDTTTPDDSPSHWSQGALSPPTVPQLSELSLDLNSELLLYGSNDNAIEFDNFALDVDQPTQLKQITIQPIVQPLNIALVPIVQPPIQPLPIVQPPQPVPIVEPPLLRKNRASTKKRQRAEEAPEVPSPQDNVALPRDTLLQITSQSMERYVETLQTSRQLSVDDQKELKRQKRLIKNRESAQLSRERKRAYIDQLEARIAQLQNENSKLANDNATLRQSLSRYQPEGIKTEGEIVPKVDNAMQQHLTKMGSLMTVGGNRTAAATKAGVCLLIVLFSFGLFMNANNPTAITKYVPQTPSLTGANIHFDRALPPPPVDVIGIKRSLLEAYPEVKIEEENDTDLYVSPSKLAKTQHYTEDASTSAASSSDAQHYTREASTTDASTSSASASSSTSSSRHHVIHLNANHDSAGIPAAATTSTSTKGLQRKIEISPSGIFKVSYSPEPANFADPDDKHSHDDPNNSTYMIFLDPRPDLDDAEMENDSAPVSATHDTQLEVATPRVARKEDSLPPMIISLVIPDHFANGSNPLLLPEGLNPAESLMEITCQVIDISITTSERPHRN